MISVVIPLFNVEDFVIDCLDSLSNQTYEDFELIIVNDGSTDQSPTIVQEYMKSSNMNIKLLHQTNAGVSAARNRGLDEVEGDYICFIDPDDLVAPNYLEKTIRTFEENQCDLVICGFRSVPENWSISGHFYSPQQIEIFDSYSALRKFLYHEIVSGVCFLMVKKELVLRGKLRFSEGYRYSEDLEFVWKVIANSNTVGYDRSQLYFYRSRTSSAMSLVDNKRLDGFKLMQRLEEYFIEFRPDFSDEYKKFGVARWVWATLWQIALASKNYRSFKNSIEKFHPNFYLKNLQHYPNKKVKFSSLLFLISSKLYYLVVKKVILKNVLQRKYHES